MDEAEVKHAMHEVLDPKTEKWVNEPLTIFVFGASGDLAKRKTFPALMDLYCDNALGRYTKIVGYARSAIEETSFRDKLRPYLTGKADEAAIDSFLKICFYRKGPYDSEEPFKALFKEARLNLHGIADDSDLVENRTFYFALPPNVFVSVSRMIHRYGMSTNGFNRLILEKPFGHDTESAVQLENSLSELFTEDNIYRIDHFLGKEMVQNVITLRFANNFLDAIWSRDHISSVTISFKEDIGTQGRGGYFDQHGIIRDMMQNHLMQVLCVIAMESPVRVAGDHYSNFVRDEKVKVLHSIEPWKLENVVLGQYTAGNGHPGYLDDETVAPNSRQPTYACVVFHIHNKRWEGVPFIIKAGKGLDQRRAEVRIQLRDAPNSAKMFNVKEIPRNELVIRLQPDEAIYMKTNVKVPGLKTHIAQSELDLTYHRRYEHLRIYDAYTRLVLDVLRGKQATFVRDDELIAAWQIVTPLLKEIEEKKVQPMLYPFGSRGPKEADSMVENLGFKRYPEYAETYSRSSKSKSQL